MKVSSCYLWVFIEICFSLQAVIGSICYFAKDECPNEDIQFWYYKKDSPESPYLLDLLNITQEMFEPQRSLEILIHGLGLNKDKTPNAEMRHLLLQHADVDVISVDYFPLARVPCYYPWAVQNTRVVAKCMALLLNSFMRAGLYTPEMIHLIGFSLGGQIAGLSANHLDFKLHKITGLDPASWGYRSSDPNDKLDPTDADFVDVIHTDPYLFSDINPMGHADFYPNLDSIIQPGCSFREEPRNCNHFRSAVYYAESITTEVGFWSYNCGNYVDYFLKQCHRFSSEHQLMGYYVSEKAKGSYFLATNSSSPFALGHFIQTELVVPDMVDQEELTETNKN